MRSVLAVRDEVRYKVQLSTKRKTTTGFTLLEVLVVLMLLSMVTGALFEGLSYTMGVRRGILTRLYRQRSGILQSFWLRSVLSGTVPVAPPREGEFSGTLETISGVSIGTLGGISGAPGQYSMTFKKEEDTLSLFYTDQYGSRFTIGEWLNAEGSFMFIDNFISFDSWPPKTLRKEYQQLPETIMIRVEQPDKTRYWAAGVSGPRDPAEPLTVQQGL